ncbi:MAG: PhoH family protein [Defluviitaleaceae bacterium]|nr:PhoH family protein [Defluviitaleaceae bacterium]MCL2836839.1 PhoH family protein [Defluviitaleaceae bacterium]
MTKIVNAPENGHITKLFGCLDENIIKIEKAFGVSVTNRDDGIHVSGAGAEGAEAVIKTLVRLAEKSEDIDNQRVDYLISAYSDGAGSLNDVEKLSDDTICLTAAGKPIRAKTLGQKKYIELMRKNTVVFSVGPAGTGKTYLSMAMAVAAFKRGEAARIILTRPAIEAGEKLGFLPGDMQQKVDPYLRPLYDALNDIMGPENHARHTEKNMIEVAPLAYMRGRTLDNSFIVLDEAQNTTPEQMKMFLTRIGFGSKCVVTGDITQIDLPEGKRSGLIEAVRILKNIEDIGISLLTNKDVVRHPLVQKIINAYDANDHKKRIREKRKQEMR